MRFVRLVSAVLLGLAVGASAQAAVLGPDFVGSYTINDLLGVPGLPPSYGGLTLLPGDTDTLLIGGAANTASGRLYTIGVTRDGDDHITGFSGSASQYGTDIGEYNDGGVVFGPGGVLFTARWPVNELGQTKPGSTDEDKIIDTAALGIAGSIAAVNFIPFGFAGAGTMQAVSYGGGQFYNLDIVADGTGTFDVTAATLVATLEGGPEGFVYVKAGNPGFLVDSLLVAEWAAGKVAAYDLDAFGNPIVSTRREFMSELSGAEGAFIDPLTGDFLFSTFGGGDRVYRISGFTVPPPNPEVPEPASLTLLGLGVLGFAGARRLRRNSSNVA